MWNDLSIPPELFEHGTITLSSNTVPAGTPIGTVVGTLSLHGKITGTYRFSIDSNPFFSVFGSSLIVSGSLVASEQSIITITISASKGEKLIRQEQTLTIASPFIPLSEAFAGEVVLTLAYAPNWLTYTIVPNNYFLLDGVQVFISSVPPVGLNPISIHASDGEVFNYTFNVASISPVWVPGMRPFTDASIANQPLADDVILVPLPWPAPFNQSFYYTNLKFFFDMPAATAPFVTVTPTQPSWGNSSAPFSRQMTVGLNGSTLDTDKEAVSIIGNSAQSYWKLIRSSNTVAGVSAYAQSNLLTADGFGTLSPFSGEGVYGSGQNAMLGVLLKEEFTAGEIQHVISLCLYFANISPGFFAPAINNDASSSTGFVSYGQFMAIPKTTAEPAGLSVYGPKIFRALQNYGAIMCDAGINQFYAANWYNSPSTSWTGGPNSDLTGLAADAIKFIPLLQKVGYPLDGIQGNIGAYAICAPQKQRLGYAGNCMTVTRDSGGSQAIGFGAAPQSLLDTALIASFGAGTTVRVATYNGQIGSHDFVSAGGNAPIIFQSGALKTVNSRPVLIFDGSTNWMDAAGTSAAFPNGSVYMAWLGGITDYTVNHTLIGPDVAGGLQLRVDITTGLVRLLKNGGATIGITPYPIPLNVPVIVSALYNADGSYSIWLNGVKMVQGTGTLVAVNAANIRVGASPGGADALKGFYVASLISSNISSNISQQQFVQESYFKNFMAPLGTIAVNSTTLDPAHKNASATLSGGNLTVSDGVAANVNAYSTASKASGKFYFEVLCVNAVGTNEVVGIANTALGTANGAYPGSTLNGVGYTNSGTVKINAATVATCATWGDNSQLAFAVDLDNSKIWVGVILTGASILWNNDILTNQNPATNTGGIDISTLNAGPYFAVLSPHLFGSSLAANFGATAYVNATLLPSGFGFLT